MIIPQNVYDIYNNTVSDMITYNFPTPCRLVYASHRTECINCYTNPVSGASSGQYKSGGPIPFNGMECPYCAGVGYTLTTQTENIVFRVYWTKKNFVKVELPLAITDSTIQTIGFITDLPKLQNISEMIANTSSEGYGALRYELAGEPLPYGFGPIKKFFVAYWNRVQ